jgi:hypothetical protein
MPQTRHGANMYARARPAALGAGQGILRCHPSKRVRPSSISSRSFGMSRGVGGLKLGVVSRAAKRQFVGCRRPQVVSGSDYRHWDSSRGRRYNINYFGGALTGPSKLQLQ